MSEIYKVKSTLGTVGEVVYNPSWNVPFLFRGSDHRTVIPFYTFGDILTGLWFIDNVSIGK